MTKVKKRAPTRTVANGRDSKGRFAKGNPGGPGNVYAKRVHEFRKALFEAITLADVKVIARRLIKQAKAGESWAIRELLDRAIGKSASFGELELAERLDAIEAKLKKEGLL